MAQPKITPVSSAKTGPNTSGDVNGLSRDAIEALPAAVYMTDVEGRLTFYNEAAAALWGCRPELDETKFCGSWKLYWPDGTRLPHDQCPMAMALHQRRPIRGMEAVAERPDGTRIPFIPYPTPLFDESGRLTGAINMLVDISERKRAEADLAERQAQLAVFVEHAPAAIAMFDRDMRYLAVSRRFVVDFRLPQDAQLIGRSHYEIFPDIPQRWRDVHARALAGEELSQEEDQFVRQDGRIDWVRWSMVPWRRADGNIGGAILFAELRTERKRAEAALNERNEQLELAGKAARVGSYTVDLNTGIIELSPGFAAIYGLPEGTVEMSRAEGRACVHQKDLVRLDAEFAQASTEQRREYVALFRIVRASDSQVRWIEARNLISYDAGRPWRIVGISIDVTERKQAETVLRKSENRLAEALTAGQVIAFEWDAATCQSRRSANAPRILGLEEGAGMRGSRCDRFLGQIHPDDRRRFKACVRALCPDNPSYALSFRFCRPDGRPLWLEETAQGEFDVAGRLLRVRGLTRDITDRKQAERALEERNLQLSLAGRAGLVGSFAYDIETEEMQVSEGYAAIHGLPEGTSQMTCGMWEAGVHPEDLQLYDELRSCVFRERRREYSAEYRIVRATGEVRWIEARCFVTYHADGHPLRVVGVNIDVTDRKRADEHQRMLVAELDHRVKNVLATVSAIASRTQDGHITGEEFVASLAGRIQSMAATHELLSRRQWKGISVEGLVRRELAPYATLTNTDINGPDLTLSPEAGQAVSMVLHELTTNAAKHGALSASSGHVSVRWYRVLNGNADARVRLEWRETGGPAVRTPRKSGYGMEVIRDLIPYELAGTVDLEFASEGVRCDFSIPGAEPNGGNRLVQRHDHLAAGA